MSGRIGTFFLFVGLVLLALFFASDLANAPRFNLFFLGLTAVVAGILLRRRGRTPPEPSGRFRLVRGIFKKQDQKEEDRPAQDAEG